MAKKVKQKTVLKKLNHPPHRGWSWYRGRWIRLYSSFRKLFRETIIYLAERLTERFNKAALHLTIPARLKDFALIALGLILIGFWVSQWWRQGIAEQAAKRANVSADLQYVIKPDLPHPVRITIPYYVDAPIVDGVIEGENWTLSEKEAIYLTQSSRPGENGNIIIYGHNTRNLMGNIRALKGNEQILLTLSNGETRAYKVTDRRQVNPDAMQYLQPTATETLTLYTCAGFADSKRFIVRAEPVPGQMSVRHTVTSRRRLWISQGFPLICYSFNC